MSIGLRRKAAFSSDDGFMQAGWERKTTATPEACLSRGVVMVPVMPLEIENYACAPPLGEVRSVGSALVVYDAGSGQQITCNEIRETLKTNKFSAIFGSEDN